MLNNGSHREPKCSPGGSRNRARARNLYIRDAFLRIREVLPETFLSMAPRGTTEGETRSQEPK